MTRFAGGLALLLGLILATPTAFANPLDLLGAYDPGSPGFNAMAVGLDGIAYLGSWGGGAQCPSLGVRVIDVHDPTAPIPIATAAVYSGTTAEHVAAVHYATDRLHRQRAVRRHPALLRRAAARPAAWPSGTSPTPAIRPSSASCRPAADPAASTSSPFASAATAGSHTWPCPTRRSPTAAATCASWTSPIPAHPSRWSTGAPGGTPASRLAADLSVRRPAVVPCRRRFCTASRSAQTA